MPKHRHHNAGDGATGGQLELFDTSPVERTAHADAPDSESRRRRRPARKKREWVLTVGLPNGSLFPEVDGEPRPRLVKSVSPRGAKRGATLLVGTRETRGRWRRTDTGWARDSRRGPLVLKAGDEAESDRARAA